jgi:hypothetical protein
VRLTQFICRHAFRGIMLCIWVRESKLGFVLDFATGVTATPLVCWGAMGDNSLVIISLRATAASYGASDALCVKACLLLIRSCLLLLDAT